MIQLSAAMRSRIQEILEGADSQGFRAKYDDNNPVALITYSAVPEYHFQLDSETDGSFRTRECPGIRSDEAEVFQRSSLELCVDAIGHWVERIIDRRDAWIMDEFGGVADRNPSLSVDKKDR